MEDVDNEGGSECVIVRDKWEMSVSASQFYCGPKTAPKKYNL